MKRLLNFVLRFSIVFFFVFSIFSKVWAVDMEHTNHLIPVPAEIAWQEGSLAMDGKFTIALSGEEESRIKSAANRLIEHLEKRTGLSLLHTLETAPQDAKLAVEWEKPGLSIQSVKEDESYSLVVTPNQAKLTASNPLGIIRGMETFLQLVDGSGDKYVAPCVTIHDHPRFKWRGLLVDVCRHWQSLEVVKRNLDGLAAAKMNVFHWHLSENQGFRVESKKYPKLQELGSAGNFYTQAQIKEVVAYARERGIRVVPEFDIPGHSTAWLVGYPELASIPGPYEIEKHYGVFDPALDPANEKVYQFLDGFVGEMATLFPDEYFHIGGDEVNGKQWDQGEGTQAFMREKGLKDNDDLQTYFNKRLLQILAKHGKKMVGWDEILHPDLPKNILVHSWRGADALAESAKDGYDGILSNGYYLDLCQPAGDHYAIDPIPVGSKLTGEQRAHILGGEACMWSELVTSETIDSRIWPRTLAVAERLWSPAEVQDKADFYRRMNWESGQLTSLGLTHQSNYIPMLKRLVDDQSVEPLQVLADVVEPLKNYQRHRRPYTSDTPMDRLVDAARPESEKARLFKAAVDNFLAKAPQVGDSKELEVELKLWGENDKALWPLLKKFPKIVEASPVSRNLSDVAQLGVEALKFIQAGTQAPKEWHEKATQVYVRAAKSHAEVELAVLPAIGKLELAAVQWNRLKKMPLAEWNQSLDAQVKSGKEVEGD